MISAKYQGLTFNSLRQSIFEMYLWDDTMPDADAEMLMEKYVLPMQHNFNNPIEGENPDKDTFIEFFVSEDDAISQDYNVKTDGPTRNEVMKVAIVDIRFVGVQAEVWAKAFHHIRKREDVKNIFQNLCNGHIMEYIMPITPVNIDYYGVGNSAIAFDLSIRIQYWEYIEIVRLPLEYIQLGSGDIMVEGVPVTGDL